MRLTQRRWKRSGWRLCRAGYRLDLIQYFLLLIHGIFLFSPCTHFSYQFEVHTHFHDQIRLCEQEIRLYELKSVFETYIYSLNGHLTRKSVYAESPLTDLRTERYISIQIVFEKILQIQIFLNIQCYELGRIIDFNYESTMRSISLNSIGMTQMTPLSN